MNLLTRRIPTLLGLLLIVAAIVGYMYFFQGKSTKTSADLVPTKVRITNIADNKFSVSWITKSPTQGAVEYGTVGDKLTSRAKDERDSETTGQYTTHHVTVEGLQPSTQYAFRILVGEKPTRFDNSGSPYNTATGPVIGATPTSQNFYGEVQLPSKQGADGSIVYLTLPGGATASTLAREAGKYAFTLSTIRSSDLRSYVKFDPSATITNVTVESGAQQSVVSASLANSAPVPLITLGQNAEFLSTAQTPTIAEVTPQSSSTPSSTAPIAETPSIFNVEPLKPGDINAVTTAAVTLTNPKETGENLATLRPEFRGTGPASTTLSIALKGQKAISDTVQIGADGTWTWAPVIDLKVGKQTITVSYVGTGGVAQKIEREFNVSNNITGLDPAFVSSPSASSKAVVSASSKPATSSATPRAAMPDTSSGTPVSGVIENTILTGGLGVVIIVMGALLLAI